MKLKKLLAGILAGVMVLGCVPQTVWGDGAGQVQAEGTTVSEEIATDKMTVSAGSAYTGDDGNTPASNVLDNNTNTIWHSNWSTDKSSHANHYLIFTFDEIMKIDSMIYQARQNVDSNGQPNNSGNVKTYTLWVSEEASGENWTQVTIGESTTGTFEDIIASQTASFDSVDAKRVKFKVESAYRDSTNWYTASAAEIRFTGTSISSTTMWEADDVQKNKIAAVTAGTSQATDASAAIDGNGTTFWCSDTSTDNGQMHKFWYDVKFTEATVVDGIRTLPRVTGSAGVITGYEVWVSNVDNPTDLSTITDATQYTQTWQSQYTKVCDGTWADNGDGSAVWKTAAFEPVQAKHVRLVATSTTAGDETNQSVTMVEFRAKQSESDTSFFQGGALRMDAADGEANLRFQYAFPETLNGMTLETGKWSWNYGTALDDNGKIANAKTQAVTSDKYKEVEDMYYSNLVFTKIQEVKCGYSLYAQLKVPYVNSDTTETLNVYTSVAERSVAGIATQIVDNYGEDTDKADQVTYAQGILQNQSMVQLGDNNQFNGDKVSVTKCEYTFTKVGDNTFTVSAKTAEGKTVYLNLPTSDTSSVHSTTSANITFVDKGNSEFAPTMNNRYLWFFYADGGNLYFKSCGSGNANAPQCKYEIYQNVGEIKEGQIIKGYDQVTALSGITEGKYLIVRQSNSGSARYLLHPTTSSINCNNTAKLLSNSSN